MNQLLKTLIIALSLFSCTSNENPKSPLDNKTNKDVLTEIKSLETARYDSTMDSIYKADSIDYKNSFKINISESTNYLNDTSLIDLGSWSLYSLLNPDISSEKIENLIPQNSKHFERGKISELDFSNLNIDEHIIHSFFYPEAFHQSCIRFSTYKNELINISGFQRRLGMGYRMSSRQLETLFTHRDSTILFIKNHILENNHLSDDFKNVIYYLNAFELIPELIQFIDIQKEVKDPYILTTLCLLMNNEYEPFIESELYTSLYSREPKTGYYSKSNGLYFNKENQETIIKLAQNFYLNKINKPAEFAQIQKGEYSLGEKGNSTNPLRNIELNRFQISRFEITNKQFLRFVEISQYRTIAEKKKNAFVFRLGSAEFEWFQDSTANWKFPNGVSEGGIENKMDHPVTCISYVDAQAYCTWMNVRLPTIAEWEVASRGNNFSDHHFFGDSTNVINEYANIWKGQTHLMKSENEDFVTTSPVGSYKSNPFGLYDIYGNVFEFCEDVPESFRDFDNVTATRGGSWWCSENSCRFFNSLDIGRVIKEASFSNNGFRVAR